MFATSPRVCMDKLYVIRFGSIFILLALGTDEKDLPELPSDAVWCSEILLTDANGSHALTLPC